MNNEFNQGQNRTGHTGDTSHSVPGSTLPGSVAKMKEQVTQKAANARETIADVGRKAVDKLNEQRQPAASSLDSAASSLHQTANSFPEGVKEGVDKVASAAHATADKLQTTADYVRNTDVNAMLGDVETLVKRYPGQSLLAAVAAGFLVGRTFRSGN